MLLETTQNSALPLIERVIDQGLKITPAPNSPMSLLVEQSVHPDIVLMANCMSPNANPTTDDVAWLNTVTPTDDVDYHAATMTDITNTVANSIRITIDTARNKVNPVVLEVVKEIEREFRESIVGVAANVTFRFSDQNSLLTNNDFITMVKHDRAVSLLNNIDAIAAYKSLGKDEILSFFKTNISSLDTDIAVWLTQFGTDNAIELFRSVFVTGHNHSVSYIIRELDSAIGIYLIARHLEANESTLDHVENIGLSKLRAELATIKAQAAFIIEAQMTRFNKTRERGVVVHSYPARNARIENATPVGELLEVVVHREQFEEFCKQGGNIEMIYGNILESDRKYNIADLLENGARAERRWENHVLQLRNMAESRKFTVFKRAIIAAIARWIADQDDFSLASEQIIAEVRQEVGRLNYDALGCIYDTVLCIVDKVLFHNSDAVKFLRIMNKYSEDQPNLDNRHIATLAATEYTAAWVSSMLLVEK